MALTLALFAYSSERGEAGEWNLDVFTGCVVGGAEASQKCKNMCGDTYKRVGGHGIQEDTTKCAQSDKPTACYCDYKIEE